MSSQQYWRSPSSLGALVLCGILAIGGFAVVSGYGWTSIVDRLLGQGDERMTFALALALVSGVLGLIALFWTLANRLAGVALVLDQTGITDYRGHRVLIPWNEIQSMDTEVQTVTDARTLINWVQEAKIVLYVGNQGGQIETVTVYASGLNHKPEEIVQQVKRYWLQASSTPSTGADASSDPNRVWVG